VFESNCSTLGTASPQFGVLKCGLAFQFILERKAKPAHCLKLSQICKSKLIIQQNILSYIELKLFNTLNREQFIFPNLSVH